MSGLTQRQHANYLMGKQGKFFLSTDKELKEPYDDLTGHITGLDYRDEEYNGATNTKLYVSITSDDGSVYKFGVNEQGRAYGNLIGFLKNADLTKEVTIVPMGEEVGDKVFTSYLVKQGGGWIKGFFKKDTPTALPLWNKVVVSGKDVWDKTDYLVALKGAVAGMQASLGNPSAPLVQSSAPVVEDENSEDSLPF